MKVMTSVLFSLAILLNLNVLSAQTTGKATVSNKTITSVDLNAETYTLSFPIEATKGKANILGKMSSLLKKELTYYIWVNVLKNDQCEGETIYTFEDEYPESSLSSMAKKNKPLICEFETHKFHQTLAKYLESCSADAIDLELCLYSAETGDKVVSKIPLKVGADVIAANKEAERNSLIKFFTSGLASRAVRDTKVEKLVESYMENKWPTENVTTVHIADLHYTNAAQTELRIEGYYITRKEGGVCKWNSFYSDAKKGTSSNFFITFFNSMTAETKMDCDIADKFRNL